MLVFIGIVGKHYHVQKQIKVKNALLTQGEKRRKEVEVNKVCKSAKYNYQIKQEIIRLSSNMKHRKKRRFASETRRNHEL